MNTKKITSLVLSALTILTSLNLGAVVSASAPEKLKTPVAEVAPKTAPEATEETTAESATDATPEATGETTAETTEEMPEITVEKMGFEESKQDMQERNAKVIILGQEMNKILKKLNLAHDAEYSRDINKFYNLTVEFRKLINSMPKYSDECRKMNLFAKTKSILAFVDHTWAISMSSVGEYYGTDMQFACFLTDIFLHNAFKDIFDFDNMEKHEGSYTSPPKTPLEASKRLCTKYLEDGNADLIARKHMPKAIGTIKTVALLAHFLTFDYENMRQTTRNGSFKENFDTVIKYISIVRSL